jgi:hypothetical protein
MVSIKTVVIAKLGHTIHEKIRASYKLNIPVARLAKRRGSKGLDPQCLSFYASHMILLPCLQDLLLSSVYGLIGIRIAVALPLRPPSL